MSNETLEQIEKYVAGTGWYVIKVMEGSAGEPAFAYTIGLTASFGHAELIILGLDLDDMHLILNTYPLSTIAIPQAAGQLAVESGASASEVHV